MSITLPIMLQLAGVVTIPLLIGFALGYGAREMVSRRRREAARLRQINAGRPGLAEALSRSCCQ